MQPKLVKLRPLAALGLVLALAAGDARAAERVPVVNIPLNSWTVVAARLGWLQAEYARHGSKIRLVDPGTTALLGAEASLLDRGDLHFAFRMIYPALVHKANGLDANIVFLSERSDPTKTPILALRDSPLATAADLKGKSLGSGRVGCGWSSPYETLKRADVPLDTNATRGAVRYSNISSATANVSALLAGQIDATAAHPATPTWAAGVTQGLYKAVARPPENGVYVNHAGRTAVFALRTFADEHPELVKAFLVVRLKTVRWIRENPDQAAAIVARETRVPVYVAKFTLTDVSAYDLLGAETSYEAAVTSIRTFRDWYAANGDDILAKHSVDDRTLAQFVDRRFFRGGAFSPYEDAKAGDAPALDGAHASAR
jgi:sulfonate transport system substrate-binding protein